MLSFTNYSYESALSYLDEFQFHGFRLGLERITAVLSALGNPERAYPCIHVAGTNGKGSVCAIVASIAQAAGYRVGLYTSPHLSSIRERFRIGNTMISEKDLGAQIWKIRDLVKAGFELSYFEYTTAVAMAWFAEQGVDLAVFETGLGGRLDATNVVIPMVSVITNISLEHQSYLGRNIAEIAREKAGIIKKEVPVVTGVREKVARSVIMERCLGLDATVWELGRDFVVRGHNDDVVDYEGRIFNINGLDPVLKGRHQADNAGLAIAACERLIEQGFRITETAVRNGCRDVNWPGRGELLQVSCGVLLDGAHNMDGVRSLKGLLSRRLAMTCHTLLWACSNEGGDKDFAGMLRQISPLFRQIIITEPPGPRSPVTLETWKASGLPKDVILEQDWGKALDMAISSCGKADLLCVAGSLYLVGAVREELMRRNSASFIFMPNKKGPIL